MPQKRLRSTFLLIFLLCVTFISYSSRNATLEARNAVMASNLIGCEKGSHKLIYFATPPHYRGDNLWYLGDDMSNPFLVRKCTYSNCLITNSLDCASQASLIVFHGPMATECCKKEVSGVRCTDGDGHKFSNYSMPPVTPTNAFVYFQHEAPSRTQHDCLLPLDDVVNYTWSYKSDADIFRPYGGFSLSSAPAETPVSTRLRLHSKNVLWYVSNCKYTKEAQSRYEYALELSKHIDVDIYGPCSGLSDGCPRGNYSCMQLSRPQYRFYLAFENSHCDEYVTEKFFDSLKYGNVPIVRGLSKSKYSALAPPNSFVHADDFSDPRELAAHLRMLASVPQALAEYHEWRKTYQVHEPDWRHNYLLHDRSSVCKLCELATLRPPKRVRVSEWWSAKTNCF